MPTSTQVKQLSLGSRLATIHLDLADGSSRWLTKDELKAEYPELYETLYAPRRFNVGGEKIKKLRKKYGLTVRELAKDSGVKLETLSAIETGRREPTQQEIDLIQFSLQHFAIKRF